MSSPQPIRDGIYRIKYGDNQGVGGEYVTGGHPEKVATLEPLGPEPRCQTFDIKYNADAEAYTFTQVPDPNAGPIRVGISYEVPKRGSPVVIESPRLFRVVPVGSVAYKIVVAEETPEELVVAVSPIRIQPPVLYLAAPRGSESIWQFELESVD